MPAEEPETDTAALTGLRVLDLSDSVAGQFCARLMADNGASVALAEPPHGSELRAHRPIVTDRRGEEASALFWHLNLGKRSVPLDATAGWPRDASSAAELLALADVVVVDDHTVASSLPERHGGRQVVVVITPFGEGDEWGTWQGSELVFQALSGTMFENGSTDREPLYGVGHRASYAAAVLAYTEAVAVLVSGASGRTRVEVVIAELAVNMNYNRVAQFSYNGDVTSRHTVETQRTIVRTADGWLGAFVNSARWRATCQGLGVEDLIDDPRFVDDERRRANWREFEALLEQRLKDRPTEELLFAGQRTGAITSRAISPRDLARTAQYVERGFWEYADGPLPRLGPMFGFARTPQVAPACAPDKHDTPCERLAQHWRGLHPPAPVVRTPGDAPLHGIRVLDFTSAWAGPLCTRVLAGLGADVLKVEGPAWLDLWRGDVHGTDGSRYPDHEPGDRPYDRHFQYNTQNHDKRGIVIDLKTERGVDLARTIATHCDVLVANFRAGKLDQMGLGWDQLSTENRGLVSLEMPAYGSPGPYSSFVALGPSMELMSGMASLIGYGDDRPVTTGPAYNDPIGALHGAAAIVTALFARATSGTGQRVEVVQVDAAMHWVGEEVIAAIARDEDPTPRGNRVPGLAPHDVFPALGDDEWVVVATHDDEEFARLWTALGHTDTPADAGLATVEDRERRYTELSDLIADWTRHRDKHQVATALQRAGVHAAAVENGRDLCESEILRRRGLNQVVTHPAAGTHTYPVLPLRVEGHDWAIHAPAPLFGEHNREILRHVVGLDDTAIDDLLASGVVADRPRG